MTEIAIEDVLQILRRATPQNARAVWDHKIVAALTDADAVDAIKAELFAINHRYERETAQARQTMQAAYDRRTSALAELVSRIEPKPFEDRSLIERLAAK